MVHAAEPMTPAIEFWSSVEVAAFQKALIRELCALGWDAGEHFYVSEYEYRHARGRWPRLLMRLRAYGSYSFVLAAYFGRRKKARVGVVCSNPFYAPAVAMTAGCNRVPVIYWVFDLFPDVLISSGWLKEGSMVERALRSMMGGAMRRVAANVFLGERQRQLALRRFGSVADPHVIHIGADVSPFRAHPPAATVLRTGTTISVLYCGNIGRMHETETVVAAMPGLERLPVRFHFAGNGPGYQALENRIGRNSVVSFGRSLPADEWAEKMRTTPVALVTLKNSAADVVMPSKTYSAFAAGQAVLAVCPDSSDLAGLIRKHDAGWIVEPGRPDEVIATFERILANPSEVMIKRMNAWRAAQQFYDQAVIARQWAELLRGVAAQRE